jgi:hypothetical protein
MDKNKPNKELEISSNNGQGEVSLPFDKSQFADFLVSLLGKPQTISKRFEGSFEVDLNTFLNLFQLLNQRIYQQNDGRLIQFRATVYYSDNSSITLNGIKHLANYNETHPLVSDAVHLTWQYLVKFNDKNNFEKQEINISFITPTGRPRRYDFSDDPFIIMSGDGQISININHTARTWGADIEALLSRHIERLTLKDSKPINFIRNKSDEIFDLLKILLFTSTLIVILFTYIANLNVSTEKTFTAINHLMISSIFMGLVFLFLRLMEFLIDRIHLSRKPSYILITQESRNKKLKLDKNFRKRWMKFIGAVLFALLTGVAANYIFIYLSK